MLNKVELGALYGLPREAQLLYCVGIRPYMNYTDQMVGHKRRISLKGLCEALYVEPHQGRCNTGEPKPYQVRTWLKNLSQSGLITLHSEISPQCKKLVMKCELVTLEEVAAPPPYESTSDQSELAFDIQPDKPDKLEPHARSKKVKKPCPPTEADLQTAERLFQIRTTVRPTTRTLNLELWATKVMEIRDKVQIPNVEDQGYHRITHEEIVWAFHYAHLVNPFWSDNIVSPIGLLDHLTRKRKPTFYEQFIDWLGTKDHPKTPNNGAHHATSRQNSRTGRKTSIDECRSGLDQLFGPCENEGLIIDQ